MIFSDAALQDGWCAPLSTVLEQMSQDQTINQYIDQECNVVDLLVSSETVWWERVKCVSGSRPGDCELETQVLDGILGIVDDIIEDESDLTPPEPVTPTPPEPVTPTPTTPEEPVIPTPTTPEPVIPTPTTPEPVIPTPPEPEPVTPTPPEPVKEDVTVINSDYLDDIPKEASPTSDDLDKDTEDFDTQSQQEDDTNNEEWEEESVLDDVYTDPEIKKRIVDGTIFLRSPDLEKLQDVQEVLEERFGDVIESMWPLFPKTGLLDDIVVDFDVDELTYQEIVAFLNTEDVFTEYALDTDTNTAIELIPNIKFSSRDDLVSRESSGSYDDSIWWLWGKVYTIDWWSVARDLDDPTSDILNSKKTTDIEPEEEYNEATAIIKRQQHLDTIWYAQIEACLEWWLPIKIAVIDNWFDIEHEDLAQKNIIAIDVADDDADIQVPKIAKEWNHGTKEAGLIWASHNDFGVKWVAPTSDLILLKSTKDAEHGADITHGIEALAAAYEQWATVINMSWWWFGNVPMLERVSNEIASKWVQLVAAAWNYNKNEPFFPAAYDRVIWVAAINEYGEKASFSNYGDRVDISAPGTEIMTTDLNNSYNRYNGTSEAAPLVAGAIALLQSVLLEPSEIQSRLAVSKEFGLWEWFLDISFLCEEWLIDRELVQSSEWYIPLADPTRYDGITDIFSTISDTVTQDFTSKLLASVLPEHLYTSIFHTQWTEITWSEKNLLRILLIVLLFLLLGIAMYIYYHTHNQWKKATNNALDQ